MSYIWLELADENSSVLSARCSCQQTFSRVSKMTAQNRTARLDRAYKNRQFYGEDITAGA
jgi:hypothetical protein